jgi:translation initiation factor 3 subunit D
VQHGIKYVCMCVLTLAVWHALQQVVHSSSVDIRPEWVVVEQIPFTSLTKLNYQAPPPEDLAFCGALEYYDKSYDRVTPKTDRPLKKTNRAFRSVTTSDDPVIR